MSLTVIWIMCARGMGSLGDEAHQETINRIEDEIERYEEVFDWGGWRNRTIDQLLRCIWISMRRKRHLH